MGGWGGSGSAGPGRGGGRRGEWRGASTLLLPSLAKSSEESKVSLESAHIFKLEGEKEQVAHPRSPRTEGKGLHRGPGV